MSDLARGETLQQQLDAFLAYAEGDVLLWHDPAGAYAPVLVALQLPVDVTLAREDSIAPFGLKVLVEGIDVDERLLVYRQSYRDVRAGDWLADIEARSDWFAPMPGAALPEVPVVTPAVASSPEALGAPAESATSFPVGSAGATAAAVPYAAEADGSGKNDAPDVPTAFPTDTAYFDSFFHAHLVSCGDIPAEVLGRQSFKVFLSRRAMAGRIFPYEEGSWITKAGLAEMGITPADLTAFAEGAVEAARSANMPCFTVPALRFLFAGSGAPAEACAAELPLLGYGFSDSFYAAVLTSQSQLLASAKLCGVRVFSPVGTSPRGRDVIEAIVRRTGSTHIDGLLNVLRRTYGIPISRGQLLTLSKKTGLYLYRGVDKLYPSYEQFLREVE